MSYSIKTFDIDLLFGNEALSGNMLLSLFSIYSFTQIYLSSGFIIIPSEQKPTVHSHKCNIEAVSKDIVMQLVSRK